MAMGRFCDWVNNLFGKSKTDFEEMEAYNVKFQNPSSASAAGPSL